MRAAPIVRRPIIASAFARAPDPPMTPRRDYATKPAPATRTYSPSTDTCNACTSVSGTYNSTTPMCINTEALCEPDRPITAGPTAATPARPRATQPELTVQHRAQIVVPPGTPVVLLSERPAKQRRAIMPPGHHHVGDGLSHRPPSFPPRDIIVCTGSHITGTSCYPTGLSKTTTRAIALRIHHQWDVAATRPATLYTGTGYCASRVNHQ